MARIITLGTAAAVPNEQHANTYLALEGEDGGDLSLIDCGENPLMRMRRAGLNPACLHRVIITHFHPDHVCGLPLLVMRTWLLGRTLPLPIYGLQDALDRFEMMMDLFRWGEWPDCFPMPHHTVPEELNAPVVETDTFRITASPVQHLIPTMGLRIENKRSGGVLAYTSDTEPCDAVIDLARDADILIHEAARDTLGHSSAAQAGENARLAGAKRLVLIHYRPAPWKYDLWRAEATVAFGGPVELARDFGVYKF